ncbi:MAG: DUF1501 domain-containing protein [Tepidisphaeraceae bacterium]
MSQFDRHSDWLTGFGLSRRQFIKRAGGGFGAIALSGMLADQARAERPGGFRDPLSPRPSHFAPRAERVIFIFATGGVSHLETFDPKPRLTADHGKTIIAPDPYGLAKQATMYLKRPNVAFQRYGKAGTEISDLFPHLGECADDLCVIRSMHGDSPGHDKATMGMHTGSFDFARPSMGSWVSYGLGTENQNLPSFVVLAPAPPYTGAQAWGSDFLPACHQGTHITPGKTPIPDVARRVPTDELQRMELDLLARANRRHQASRAADLALEGQIRAFETAFGMQKAAPEAFDLSGEDDETLALYGLKRGGPEGFGWQCLMARRLAERGVRFIELLDVGSGNNWDSHVNMDDHVRLAKNVDQPMAGLLHDLKRRVLLDSTLVVWTTEFGRTPFNTTPQNVGRDHYPKAFSSWMAGAGIRGGLVHGATDDIGAAVVENGVHVHDLHATILHLLGLDHERLTYRFSGRDFRLTDVAGKVVKGILS